MKTIKTLGIAFLSLLAFNACEEEDNFTIDGSDTVSAVINLPQNESEVVLDIANPEATALTVVWDEATYTFPTNVTYTLQLAVADTDFANPIDAGTTTENFLAWTNEQLNGVAVDALGFEPFSPADAELRIKSVIGDNAEEAFSNAITLRITPYTTEAPKVYVVGNFLAASGYGADWTPADAVPIASSAFGATDFEGYVYMNVPSPEFKILPTNESFDGDYGDDNTFSGTLIQEGESNITIGTGAGVYYIQADTEQLTYSAQNVVWAITGAATPAGWPAGNEDQGQDMTFNATTGKWEITIALTGGNEYKFRANDNWSLNLGTDDNADESLDYNGGNFSVENSGTYLVELDLSNPRGYTQTITAQ